MFGLDRGEHLIGHRLRVDRGHVHRLQRARGHDVPQRVGQRLQLRLVEANPVSGALRFELPEGSYSRGPTDRRDRVRKPVMGRRGRPANIRHQGRKKR